MFSQWPDSVTNRMCSFLYVLSAGATSIDVLSLDAPGDAKAVERLDIAGPPRAAGVSISEYTSWRLSPLLLTTIFPDAFNLQGMTHFVTQ